jgi:hypothetical protein
MTTRSEAAVRGWDTRREHEAEQAEVQRQERAAWQAWDDMDSILVRFEGILRDMVNDDTGEGVEAAWDRRKRFYAALVGADKFGYPNVSTVRAAILAVNER